MAFDKIKDLVVPIKPAAPADPYAVKPFGNTPIDPLTGHPIYANRSQGNALTGASLGDSHMGHHANLIKYNFEEGKVKLFQDAKGVAERTEINLDEGKVVVYKDYGFSPTLAHYKKIEILGLDGQVRSSIDMIPNDRTVSHTGYRFFYEGSMIGTGNGDIGLFIAQGLVSRTIQPRSGMGTGVDQEIITTIKNALSLKRA